MYLFIYFVGDTDMNTLRGPSSFLSQYKIVWTDELALDKM